MSGEELPAPTQTIVEGKPRTRGYLYRFDRWGQDYWRVLHAATFLYPEQPTEADKARMIALLRLVPYLLPCSACGLHFAQQLQGPEGLTAEVLATREAVSRWLVDAHNEVNRRVGKPEVAYERVRHFYTKDADCALRAAARGPDPALPYKVAVTLLALALVAAIVVAARRRSRG